MNLNKDFKISFLLLAFLFISFIIITGGFVIQVLPCQTQYYLQNSIYGKHIVGILVCYLFIMLEGGLSFNMDLQNQHSVDYSNANAFSSLFFGFLLYVVFLLTAKMKLIPNSILFTLLFITYLLNTQRQYWINRDLINSDQNLYIQKFILILIGISIFTFFYGIIDYFIYQLKDKGKKFNLLSFILGSNNCKAIKVR